MTDLELDAISEGVFKYLQEQAQDPMDVIAILGITLIKTYKSGTGTITLERFAEDFKQCFIASAKAASAIGTETRQ